MHPATALLLLPLLVEAGDEPSSTLSARGRALEEVLDRALEVSGVPAISAALADDEGVVWSATIGVRDWNTAADVTRDTAFEAASLSKPVFAYVCLQLVDEGLLDLDAPLAEVLPHPDAKPDERLARITARHVLSHASGFPNWRPRGGELELEFDPGEGFQYSGEGFVWLQAVVEHATGRTLDEVARELVFEPLSMTRSSYVWDERFGDDVAAPHDAEARAGEVRHHAEGNAAYTLLTTVGDYARFLSALLRGERLSKETARAFLEPWSKVDAGVAWGLGVGLEERPDVTNGRSFWHWGHNDGYRAYFVAFPDRREAFVLFTNGGGGMSVLRDLARIATGESFHPALDWLDYEDRPLEEATEER